MTSHQTSAPGFDAAQPTQAVGVLMPGWEYEFPTGEQQGIASFRAGFQALDAPLVRLERAEGGWMGSRRRPRLGIAQSSGGRATDVDNAKGAPYSTD